MMDGGGGVVESVLQVVITVTDFCSSCRCFVGCM